VKFVGTRFGRRCCTLHGLRKIATLSLPFHLMCKAERMELVCANLAQYLGDLDSFTHGRCGCM
jgi:hypothetical protein